MQIIIRKQKYIEVIPLILAASFFLLGCNRQDMTLLPLEMESTSFPGGFKESNTDAFPTLSPNLPQATRTSTPLIVTTKTSSPKLKATLLPEQQEPYIFNLIKTNGNCKLPCFWGISPGYTNWDDALQLLHYLGAKFSIDGREAGNYVFAGFDLQEKIPVRIVFVEQGGIIEAIDVDMGRLHDLDWQPYKLSSILTTFGPPSKIFISIPQPVEPPGISTGYELWLVYDDYGFLVAYFGANLKIQSMMQLCPNSPNSSGIDEFYMYLHDQNIQTLPENITTAMTGARELGTVTNLSIDEFYRIFKKETATDCIETDKSNW